jgi:hypothetical protein
LRSAHGACLALVVAACTGDNPLYTSGKDLSTGDAAMPIAPGPDMTIDLSMSTAVDLSPPPCTASQRSCDGKDSERCKAGLFVPDRQCPAASMCESGYCSVPPGSITTTTGKSCVFGSGGSNATCATGAATPDTCQPFISSAGPPAQVTWVCDTPVGAGVAGTACTKDADCGSGFCALNGSCFSACATVAECPSPAQMQCKQVTIVVEGATVLAMSCTAM